MKALLASEYSIRQCTKVQSNIRAVLLRVENIVASDAGDNAEVFGDIVFTILGQEKYMWSRAEKDHVSVRDNGGIINNINVNFDKKATTDQIQSGEAKIKVYINLIEGDDSSGDDLIGSTTLEKPIKDLAGKGPQITRVSQSDRHADVVWEVKFVE